MAFVYRKLTQEERAYIASFKIRAVLGGGIVRVPNKASVDEERGIYYFPFQGQGYRNGEDDAPPDWCSFIWNGDVFRITMYRDWFKMEDGNTRGVYRILTIYAPEKYMGKEEEFIQAIKEAITAHATYKGYTSVEFLEMARPQYKSYDISQTGSYA